MLFRSLERPADPPVDRCIETMPQEVSVTELLPTPARRAGALRLAASTIRSYIQIVEALRQDTSVCASTGSRQPGSDAITCSASGA